MKNIVSKIKEAFSTKSRMEQFLPAVLEITETPPSPLGRIVMWMIILFFTIAILIACFTNVDIIAVAPGKIISSGKIKLIQPLKSGVVFDVYVKDGQTVNKGDPLVKIKFEDSEGNKARLEQELIFARLDVARLEALLKDDPINSFTPPKEASQSLILKHENLLRNDLSKHISEVRLTDDQLSQAMAEKETVKSEIKKIKRILPNVRERVNAYRKLLENKLVARTQFLEIEQNLFEYEETLKVNENHLKEAEAKIELLKSQKGQVKIEFKNETMHSLKEAYNKEEVLQKEYDNAVWLEGLTEIKAPEDGVIQELEIHTIGGIVTPAQTLMKLVPKNAKLEVEATFLNKDIGFVKEGQYATVKIDSFPYTKYGTIDGEIITISKDATENEKLGLIYISKISLKKTVIMVEGKEVNLSSGMTTTIEAKTGKRRLIEYIIAPFLRYKSESMKER
ncbi:MAG: Hemolysin secretion protein D, chromosomal [Alphaproteobacteria bacterium ADurb.Bin438]|nr:MAG: Hemolysin secretion protein D, chromosomal [Alphaproteobacteria bacterium ADurb.Bin438]